MNVSLQEAPFLVWLILKKGEDPKSEVGSWSEYNLKRFKKGDRVIVYHISGCGVCYDCRRGYMISCTSPFRAAYGWQRDGGMAPYILAEEKDLVVLAKAMGANKLIGVDAVDERLEIAQKLGLADHVLKAGPENVREIRSLTNGYGVERALDASGSDKGRLTAIQATRKWGRDCPRWRRWDAGPESESRHDS